MTQDAVLESLRYPVGRFQRPGGTGGEARAGWLAAIESLPERLRAAVSGLDDARLDTPYREGGWTVRQVVHHVADSHINGYLRFMLATVEEGREAPVYDEKRWAGQPFPRTAPLEPSLTLLDGLHARWSASIRALPDDAWSRTVRHAEWGEMTVTDIVALYAWHGRHHVAHIDRLRERAGG